MAEGDSILRLARRLDEALAGAVVSVRTPGPRRLQGRPATALEGRTLEGAASRGKHLLLSFSDGLVLHSHLGMHGAWHLYGSGERWRRPAASAWIALSDGRTEAVNFNGTSMRIVRAAELARDPRLARLGVDILGESLALAEAVAALRRAGPQAELGDALLDQTLLAGIGNIFKSEGCFAAAVDPWRPLGSLSDSELERVVAETRELMVAAAASGRQSQRVYRRAGKPCPRCGSRLRSRAQGDSARTTYWCPGCQV
jgi:endonuclease-8